jgi:hypothetical protein
MLHKRIIDRIIPILKKDARRALTMRVKGFPRPYYCSFLLRDIRWFNTWASSGSTYRKRSDHTRNVYCDLRLGSYRCDQTIEGGLRDNDEELDSVAHVTVPIELACGASAKPNFAKQSPTIMTKWPNESIPSIQPASFHLL